MEANIDRIMKKLDVSDALYDSCSSSVSSDGASSDSASAASASSSNHPASGGSSSRISHHDFLSTIGAYTPGGGLVSLDGLHSGVPTRTTPTLTPTTLRTIEETFLDFTNEPASHSREAGFVPPLIEPSQPTPAQTQNIIVHSTQVEQSQHQQQQQHHIQQQQQQQQQQSLIEIQQTQPVQQQQQQQQPTTTTTTTTTRRNMGGRRPTRTIGMSPEEEERRQIRRERNKMAAARCRKRRMDHTNSLLEETEGLEQKKQSLQDEIQQLQEAKDQLEFMMEAHRGACRLQSSSPPDIKPVIVVNNRPSPVPVSNNCSNNNNNNNNELRHEEFADLPCQAIPISKPQGDLSGMSRASRPNTLPVNGFDNNNQRPNSLPIFTEPKPRPSSLQFKANSETYMKASNEVAGITISTPSNGMSFNFESLMDGGTGLTPTVSTPLVPSCSSQQRHNGTVHMYPSAVDLSSPDANPPKLVSL